MGGFSLARKMAEVYGSAAEASCHGALSRLPFEGAEGPVSAGALRSEVSPKTGRGRWQGRESTRVFARSHPSGWINFPSWRNPLPPLIPFFPPITASNSFPPLTPPTPLPRSQLYHLYPSSSHPLLSFHSDTTFSSSPNPPPLLLPDLIGS
ncbi:hypothetical protein CALCODRAFT_380072 [Calocera cornea HHB12733]|uniref:Uncharacterized protein n=1 Tax=Calocera cornea HHB12733 TaxID=1353952 RepID=A0A165ECL2_9BASI|nr:hypothetical protein CALCODRAFT_380072 [Calocera cornea HHB12733]